MSRSYLSQGQIYLSLLESLSKEYIKSKYEDNQLNNDQITANYRKKQAKFYISRAITLYCITGSCQFSNGTKLLLCFKFSTSLVQIKSKMKLLLCRQSKICLNMPNLTLSGAHNSVMHDGIKAIFERNQVLLLMQVLSKFGSNKIKETLLFWKQSLICLIWPFQGP